MLATEDRSDAKTLGAIGLCSGALAWLLIDLARVGGVSFDLFLLDQKIWLAPWSLLPGAVFGLGIGTLLQRRGTVTGFRPVGFATAALVAYCCAFHVAMHIVPVVSSGLDPSKSALGMGIAGIAAGLAGSALLGAMTIYLLKAPARLVLRVPVLVGTAAGALLSLMALDGTEWGWSQLILFASWQSAYAASLAPLLRATISAPEKSSSGEAQMLETRDQAKIGSAGSLTGALLAFALLSGGGPSAQAMTLESSPEDITNSKALIAAPWLVCESGPDPVSATPKRMRWNWENERFEEKERFEESVYDGSELAILFDEGKRRAKMLLLESRTGQILDPVFEFPAHLNGMPRAVVWLQNEFPGGAIAVVISHRHAGNGAFIAIGQLVSLWSADPEVVQVPLHCAPTVDDALTQRIEQARAQWLAVPAAPKASPQ